VYTVTKVSIRELRNNLSEYLRKAERGESVGVTRRGKLIATIRAEREVEEDPDAWLWKAVREGKISWSGKKFRPGMPTVRLKGEGPNASEMIIEDRG
jgi:antitoxin (DNA-binding transcriptional repressor) of toxin-antitoxin stability system